MKVSTAQWPTVYRRALAITGAGALMLAVTVPLATSASAAPEKVTVTYPSPSSPAGAQADEWFDFDVELSSAGTVRASIRGVPLGLGGPRGPRPWIPLEVATEAQNQAVAEGAVAAMAKAPAGTEPGRYELRVELLGDDGKVLGAHWSGVRGGGVTIEDHELPTGFETADGTTWTTFAQEQSFLADLAGASPRTALTQLGESVNGLPYNLLTIGAPTPPDLDEIDGNAVLLVCSQHGNEPSGREGCLQDARRLALTEDARIRDYLAENTVLIIPSANPDGSVANTRRNANDVDLNRDHLRAEEPETVLLHKVMRDTHPETVHDLHEMSGQSRPHLETIWGRHLGIDEEIRDFGVSWGTDWVRPRVEAAGFTTGPYLANPGGGENTTLTNGAMLRNLSGVISETNTAVLAAENETPQSSQLRRVETQRISILETLRQHRLHQPEMAQAFDDANARNIEMGFTQEGPYFFGGNSESSDPPPPDSFIMDVPCGYLLTAEQVADRAQWMELFDVTALDTSEPGYAAFVPMWQVASAVIPMMFDARALGSNKIEAVPVQDCSTAQS